MSESGSNKHFPRLGSDVAGEGEVESGWRYGEKRKDIVHTLHLSTPQNGPQSNSVLFNRAPGFLQPSGSINLPYPSTFWQGEDSFVFYERPLEIIVRDRLLAASRSHQVIH